MEKAVKAEYGSKLHLCSLCKKNLEGRQKILAEVAKPVGNFVTFCIPCFAS